MFIIIYLFIIMVYCLIVCSSLRVVIAIVSPTTSHLIELTTET